MQQPRIVHGCRDDKEVLNSPVLIIIIGLALFSTLALCIQISFVVTRGFSSSAGLVYIVLAAILAIGTWLSAILLKREIISPRQTVHAYAWTGMVVIVGMVIADYFSSGAGFPMILVTLCIGCFLLGVLCHWRIMLPYSIISAAIILAAGVLYQDIGDAVALVMGVGLADLSAIAVEALIDARIRNIEKRAIEAQKKANEAKEAADALQQAIRIITNAGKKLRDTE